MFFEGHLNNNYISLCDCLTTDDDTKTTIMFSTPILTNLWPD